MKKARELRIGQGSAFVSFCDVNKERQLQGERNSKASGIHTGAGLNGTCHKERWAPSSSGVHGKEAGSSQPESSQMCSEVVVPSKYGGNMRGFQSERVAQGQKMENSSENNETLEERTEQTKVSPIKNSPFLRFPEREKYGMDEYCFRRSNLGFRGEKPEEKWPSRRPSPMESVLPPVYPPNMPFSILKLHHMVPEMGPMLPPAPPSHNPVSHIIPSSVSGGIPALPGLPQPLHPSALMSQLNPMYSSMIPPETNPLNLPPGAMIGPHGHPHLNIHNHHFPLYVPPVLGAPPPQPLLAPNQHLIGPGPPQAPHWPASMPISLNERKLELAERREAALNKFRRKRKDRCFEKKIRYVSRKRLAEQRPRNRGQFVKQVENGAEKGEDDSEDEEEYDEEEENGDDGSSPEYSSKAVRHSQ